MVFFRLVFFQVQRKKTGEVGLIAKAWNGRCILSWLSHCLQDALVLHGDNEKVVLSATGMILSWNCKVVANPDSLTLTMAMVEHQTNRFGITTFYIHLSINICIGDYLLGGVNMVSTGACLPVTFPSCPLWGVHWRSSSWKWKGTHGIWYMAAISIFFNGVIHQTFANWIWCTHNVVSNAQRNWWDLFNDILQHHRSFLKCQTKLCFPLGFTIWFSIFSCALAPILGPKLWRRTCSLLGWHLWKSTKRCASSISGGSSRHTGKNLYVFSSWGLVSLDGCSSRNCMHLASKTYPRKPSWFLARIPSVGCFSVARFFAIFCMISEDIAPWRVTVHVFQCFPWVQCIKLGEKLC